MQLRPEGAGVVALGAIDLTVVIPFFNEMHRLGATIDAIVALGCDGTEVLLVDDGSTDGTGEALQLAALGVLHVEVIRLPHNQGKGAAVRAGVASSRGDRVVYMDADLATDVLDLPRLCAALDHADIAIGSRSMPAAQIRHATFGRTWIGGAFNRAVRTITGLPMLDTQCGFKALRGEVARSLFADLRVDRFAFDVELLVRARERGMLVAEVPVRWSEVGGSRVRFAVDPIRMLYDLLRLQRQVRRSERAVSQPQRCPR